MNEKDRRISAQLANDFQLLHPEVKKLEPKFAGGSGYIFCLEFADGTKEALKIFRPDQAYEETLLEGFREEGKRLVSWTHPHIVQGLEVNSATFKSVNAELPYYKMEFFPHSSIDKALSEGFRPSLSFLVAILRQVLDALRYLHQLTPPLCHLDVKEANLLLDISEPTMPRIKLSDFGLAKEVRLDETETEVRGSLYYWPLEWYRKLQGMIPSNNNRAPIILPRKDIPVHVDLHMLAVTLKRLLSRVEPFKPAEYLHRALALLAERMNWDECTVTTADEKYKSSVAVIEDLEKIDKSFTLPWPLTDMGMVRIPVNSLSGFGEAARSVIDLPWFQRLRGVRQLGTTHLVFPGAVHTRFEHAIGAFAQSVEYLRALLSNQNSPWFLIYLNDEEIRAVALTALLHDLGHYPFAHQLEDLANWREHEQLSFEILSGRINQLDPLLEHEIGPTAKMLEQIEAMWRVDRDLMLAMFAYCYRKDLEKNDALKEYIPADVPRSWRVASEIVNGPIDADKLDYIRRDAEHCGVSYGLISDPSRFLSSLTVAFDKQLTRLAVTEKGRVDAEFVAVIRYAMFSEVYWHHTVRAFTTMLRRAFFQASNWRKNPLTIDQLLRFSDDKILNDLRARAREKKRVDEHELLSGIVTRRPYRRLLTLRQDNNPALYKQLTSESNRLAFMAGKKWKEIDKEVCEKVFGIRNIKSHHVLWDIPKPSKDSLGEVCIAGLDGNVSARTPGPLWESLASNFAQWVRRIRIFIHPDVCPAVITQEKNDEFQRELSTHLNL